MRKLILLVCLPLVLFGCGGAGAVGSHCSVDGDCDGSQHLVCNTALPQGYCTLPCATPGQVGVCPGNSICGLEGNTPICLHICNSIVDCRPNYNCNGITGSTAKACQ